MLTRPFASTILLLCFAAVSLFGVFFCSEMLMDMSKSSDMTVSHCMTTGYQSSACGMDLSAHFSSWQQLLAGFVSSIFSLLIILVIVGARTGRFTLSYQILNRSPRQAHQHQRHRPPDLFTALFAQGILQPKIFA